MLWMGDRARGVRVALCVVIVGLFLRALPLPRATCFVPNHEAPHPQNLATGSIIELMSQYPPAGSRRLIYVAVDAGLADRITGTITAFFFALFSGRRLFATQHRWQASLESAFNSSLSPVNWPLRPPLPSEITEPLAYTYRGERGYNGERTLPAAYRENFAVVYGINNNGLRDEIFSSSLLSAYPRANSSVETILFTTNRGGLARLLTNPYYRWQFTKHKLSLQSAFSQAFWLLFSPSEKVKELQRSFETFRLQDPGALLFGIHIRVGDRAFESNNSVNVIDSYRNDFDCAEKLSLQANASGVRARWYFVSDSAPLRREAKVRYGKMLETEIGHHPMHIDCYQNAKLCINSSLDFAIQFAAAEMLNLARCDVLLIGESGYGRIAAWLNHSPNNVYISSTCDLVDRMTFALQGAGI